MLASAKETSASEKKRTPHNAGLTSVPKRVVPSVLLRYQVRHRVRQESESGILTRKPCSSLILEFPIGPRPSVFAGSPNEELAMFHLIRMGKYRGQAAPDAGRYARLPFGYAQQVPDKALW